MKFSLILTGIILIIFIPQFEVYAAKAGYTEGDWVSFGPARTVTSIAVGRDEVYFGTTDAGVLRMDKYSEKWGDPLTTSDGLPSNNILRIAYDPDKQELWIDTDLGVGIYETTFQDFIFGGSFPSELVQSDSYRPDDLFTEFGYSYFPGYVLGPHGRKHHITASVVDRSNYRAWVGINGIGPAKVNTRAYDMEFLRFGPYSEDQRAIADNGETLFAGGYPDPGLYEGVTFYDLDGGEWLHYESGIEPGLPGARVNCAYAGDEAIWFGTNTGLIRYDTYERKFRPYTVFNGLYSDYVSTIYVDGDYVWVGTDNGLNLLKFTGDKLDTLNLEGLPRDQSFFGQFVYDVQFDEVFMYVGTQTGIYYRTRQGEFWQRYNPGIIGGRRDITAVLPTSRGLWLGHPGEVIFFNPADEIRTGYNPPGLGGSANINDIIAYEDIIFAATDNGLLAIRPSTAQSRLYTEDDGLIVSQVYDLTTHREYLWCATPRGLTRVYIPALEIY
ncbi:MAG: hypothetical protein GF307_15120 [candidate division Zixibacteria bacterium]|nr:hypothetical protein [candidate division Zixibacteria bacterium]